MRLPILFFVASASILEAQARPVLAAHSGNGPTFFLRSTDGRHRIGLTGAPVLTRRVSLSVSNVPIADVLDSIAVQANVHVAYSPGVVNVDARVTMRAEDLSVGAALTEALMDAALDVEIIGADQITLVTRVARRQERRRVSGHVLDA